MSETFVSDGFQVESSDETPEQIKANLESEEQKPDEKPIDPEQEAEEKVKKAASELGKRGGKAAAEARAAKAEEEKPPEPEKPAEKPEKVEAKPETKPEEEHSRAKARIERLARERAEERQKREAAEAEIERMRAERQAKPDEDPKRPKMTDYATAEEYAESLADYKTEQKVQEALKRREEEDRVKAYVRGIDEKVATFRDRIKAEPELVRMIDPEIGNLEPTWVLKPGVEPGPLNVIADELIASEAVVPLMLHLTNHPEEFERLQALPNAREIARAVAKLEDKLTAEPPRAQVRETVSKAAPPARSVPTSVQTDEEDVDGDDVPFERHFRVYNSRERKRVGR